MLQFRTCNFQLAGDVLELLHQMKYRGATQHNEDMSKTDNKKQVGMLILMVCYCAGTAKKNFCKNCWAAKN